jgi:hypothetical protein
MFGFNPDIYLTMLSSTCRRSGLLEKHSIQDLGVISLRRKEAE